MSRLVDQYPEYILEYLRQREGLDEDDDSQDDYFNDLGPDRVFDEVCEWEGLCGYSGTIRGWIRDIYGIDFDDYRYE